jgi:hypothetical protein
LAGRSRKSHAVSSGDEYTGTIDNLRSYISSLAREGCTVRVAAGYFVLGSLVDERDSACVEDVGYDVIYRSATHLYSVVLHSLAGDDVIANYIAENLNDSALLASYRAAQTATAMLKKTKSAPIWLEPSLTTDTDAHLKIYHMHRLVSCEIEESEATQ